MELFFLRLSIFPNSSIAGIFFAMLLLLLIQFLKAANNKLIRIVLICCVIFLFSELLLSNSRAGWLGFIVGGCFAGFNSSLHEKTKKFNYPFARVFIVFGLIVLLLAYYKKNSSAGRLHIYNVSMKMLKENWPSGIDGGKFKSTFNEYQADYFSHSSINSKRALLADNTFYAFNDFLQWLIERGLTGLVLLLLFGYLAIKRIRYLLYAYPKSVVIKAVIPVLICAAVASLFSYPFQVLSIQAFVISCLAIIAFYPVGQGKAGSLLFNGFIIVMIIICVNNAVDGFRIRRMEKEAFHLARTGYKDSALRKCEQLLKRFPNSGYNWYFYAEQLYYSNRLTEAYASLKTGMLYYVDNNVYRLKAEIEMETGRIKDAEKSYLRALYMVPNRMGSRIDLMNFYVMQKDTVNAVYWAYSIIHMPVKIPSEKTAHMLTLAQQMLDRLK
ncbi:MAG: O-antigen ligase family protein [Bacteroidetes bacterium]|nr:O-antigen ligase family protein [Bacteroidota bacterium]